MIGNLSHVVIEHPLGIFPLKLLVGDHGERLFHIHDFFRCDLDAVCAQDHHRHIARVAVENREAHRMVELGVPLSIAGKLAEITGTVSHGISPFGPDCTRETGKA